jgi:hypothetical protein
MFKKSAFTKDQIFNLDFAAAPPAGYTVKIYSVAFQAGKSVPPQFIGVAFPMDIDISKAPPFLVHYKHVPGQSTTSTLFKHFAPLGFDWLYYELWTWWVLNARQTGGNNFAVDMPFLSLQQFSFGFPYQLRQAKKPYVIVLPHISRIFDPASNGKLQDYQLYSAETLREILLAIQADILKLKDDKLQTVAISANSSGCNILSTFLTENAAAAKSSKTIAEFLNNELNEIFILDPPEGFGDAMVNSLLGWRGRINSRDSAKKKAVRFYTHSHTKNFASLTDNKKDPFTKNTHGFWESADKSTSLAYLPFEKGGNDVWQRTLDEIDPNNTSTLSNFAFVHHVIPALFLTDAARRSQYV